MITECRETTPHPPTPPGRRPQTLSRRPGKAGVGGGGARNREKTRSGRRTKGNGAGLETTEWRGGGRRAREEEGEPVQKKTTRQRGRLQPSGETRQKSHGGFRFLKKKKKKNRAVVLQEVGEGGRARRPRRAGAETAGEPRETEGSAGPGTRRR